MSSERPSWDDTFMAMAHVLAARATCPRLHVGAVIVTPDTHAILSCGYNGSVRGQPHCADAGCAVDAAGHCTQAIHGEANAILHAARLGVSLDGAVLYVTHTPCLRCAGLIAQVGITEVVSGPVYGDGAGVALLEGAAVMVRTALAARAGTYAFTALDEGYSVIRLALGWFQGSGRRVRHNRTRLAIVTHMVEDLANDPETRKVMTAIKVYLVGCTQSGRAAMSDHLRFPARLVERAPDLRRDDDKAEMVYMVRPPDRAPEYAVIHVKLVPELAYCLGSYGPQKDQRARDIAIYGSLAAAAEAVVSTTARHGDSLDTKEGAA